jgi:hypothetical protein
MPLTLKHLLLLAIFAIPALAPGRRPRPDAE